MTESQRLGEIGGGGASSVSGVGSRIFTFLRATPCLAFIRGFTLAIQLWFLEQLLGRLQSVTIMLVFVLTSLSSISVVVPRTTKFQACPRQSSQAGIKQKLSSAACFKPCGSVQAVAGTERQRTDLIARALNERREPSP